MLAVHGTRTGLMLKIQYCQRVCMCMHAVHKAQQLAMCVVFHVS